MRKLVLLTLLIAVAFGSATAKISKRIPIKKGVLPNGITYYIVESLVPEKKASYYLLQNVGALLEDDTQKGLAHFLEHMAFKGTKSFPKRTIHNLFESKGLEGHVNAFTALDKTRYWMEDVPTDDQILNDQCLLILKEWCNDLLLQHSEIDSERPVIVEEIRMRNNLGERLNNATYQVTMNGAKHARRTVGGDPEVIKTFDRSNLVKFYKDWYRTDLQCVIVVGDVDGELVEQKIKNIFSDIPPKQNAKPRKEFEIEDHEVLHYAVFEDKGLPALSMSLRYRFKEKKPDNSVDRYRYTTDKIIISQILNRRVEGLQKETKDVVDHVNAELGSLTRLYGQMELTVVPKKGKEKEAFKIIAGLAKAIDKNGFTQKELDNAKSDLTTYMKLSKNDYKNLYSPQYIGIIESNYLYGNDILDGKEEYKLTKDYMKVITLDHINSMVMDIIGKNKSAMSYNRTGADNFTKEEVEEMLANAEPKDWACEKTTEELVAEARKEQEAKKTRNASEIDLIAEEITPGKIESESTHQVHEATKIVLSNGATVVIKNFKSKQKNVLFKAISEGGFGQYEGDNKKAAFLANLFNQRKPVYGVKGVNQNEWAKFGNKFKMGHNLEINETNEAINGNFDGKSAEKFFELIYNVFMNPQVYEDTYNEKIERASQAINQRTENWEQNLSRDITKTIQKDNYVGMTRTNLETLTLDKFERIFKERFSNASDWTFYFVGNIDVEKFKELAENYIGAISSTGNKEVKRIAENGFPNGYKQIVKKYSMPYPKGGIKMIFRKKENWTWKEKVTYDYISQHLRLEMQNFLRLKLGAVYGVDMNPEYTSGDNKESRMSLSFTCDPERIEEISKAVKGKIQDMIANGMNQEQYDNIKIKDLSGFDFPLDSGQILDALVLFDETGEDMTKKPKIKEQLESIDLEFVNRKLKEFFSSADLLDFIYMPAS
jgi:zinc protease